MPEQDYLQIIASSELDQPLKNALSDLFQAGQAFIPQAKGNERFLFSFGIVRVVQEALGPVDDDTHWWESLLYMAEKAASRQDEAYAAVYAAITRVKPLLAAHLGPYEGVTLREITEDTVRGVCLLSDTLSEPKRYFVAPNAISLAQALFSKVAWYRAIYAGRAAVGFLMLFDNPDEPVYFLWRFMIAEPFQGRGYGRQALERLVEYVRTRPGVTELKVSCGLGEGSPLGFYEKCGFTLTGDKIGHEVVLRIALE